MGDGERKPQGRPSLALVAPSRQAPRASLPEPPPASFPEATVLEPSLASPFLELLSWKLLSWNSLLVGLLSRGARCSFLPPPGDLS